MSYSGQNGFYCCRYLSEGSVILLRNYLKSVNVTPDTEYPFHVSSIFSEYTPSKVSLDKSVVFASTSQFAIVGSSLAVLLDSKTLEKHFDKWKSLGCVSIFDYYVPHVTIIDDITKMGPDNETLKMCSKLPVNLNLFLEGEECFDLQN
jgi:hypothetical protein